MKTLRRNASSRLWSELVLLTWLIIALALGITTKLVWEATTLKGSEANSEQALTFPSSLVDHPRLVLTNGRLRQIRESISEDKYLALQVEMLLKKANDYLEKPALQYKVTGGRLLSISREFLDRQLVLVISYRLTERKEYARKAILEMEAVATFPDWHPSHFLDTAEMTAGMAFGFDQLYPLLNSEEKNALSSAITEKGLKEYLSALQEGIPWSKTPYNWNFVVNGGMILGALAVYESAPKLAQNVVENALARIPTAMKTYDEEGIWPEGPDYWAYATFYHVLALSGLESAVGQDFGLSKGEGLRRTGDFAIYFTGPTGEPFNFGDASARKLNAPQLLYLARKFDNPLWSKYVQDIGMFHPLNLVWYEQMEADVKYPSPSKLYVITEGPSAGFSCAFLRNDWGKSFQGDNNVIFVGIQAGGNRKDMPHSHWDQGSFVLDMLGERWIIDLGSEPESYSIPSKARRRDYYRINSLGHNIISIDGKPIFEGAVAPIVDFGENEEKAWTALDLTMLYPQEVARWQRRINVEKLRCGVTVEDEVRFRKAAKSAEWRVHTRAKVELLKDGRSAILRQAGKELSASIVAPRELHFTVEEASPPPKPAQAGNEGVWRLKIPLILKEKVLQLTVVFSTNVRANDEPHLNLGSPSEESIDKAA